MAGKHDPLAGRDEYMVPKALNIGAMARRAGLSRATLLYYDRIGLLCPEDRSAAGYRLYGAASQQRLTRLLELRQAGLPLEEIARLLDGAGPKEILERQLVEIDAATATLAGQKSVLQQLLGRGLPQAGLTRQDWAALFAGIGLSEAQMWAWHHDFEVRAPEAHAAFLAGLGIAPAEVARIRQLAASDLLKNPLPPPPEMPYKAPHDGDGV